VRTCLEIFQFELRQQLKSPFVLAVLAVFFAIHFLATTSTGINLWAHPLANLNSAYAIAVTETTLAIFGMLPVVVFVAKAILRDHETATAALFFCKPISKHQYLSGRFFAVCALVALVGLVGVLGSLVGTLMPWLDQERIAPFSLRPFLFCFCAIVLPNMLVQCALFFSVASLTRSLATTVGLAMVFLVGNVALGNYVLSGSAGPGGGAFVLADHSGALVVSAATRNLTVAELNTLLPLKLLLENRLLWLGIAGAVLAFSLKRFRFELSERSASISLPFTLSLSKGSSSLEPKSKNPSTSSLKTARTFPVLSPSVAVTGRTDQQRALWATALTSQLHMDLRSVLRSPLFLLILVLGIADTVIEYGNRVSPLANLPLHPVTSVMLGFFRYGLIQFVLIIAIYYSGPLVHRERESGVAEIVGASPFPDWISSASKTLALCTVVALLLLATMLTSIAVQASNGYTNFELALYLRTAFLHNGFYFWMLCVLAVFVQANVSNKWIGMLLLLVVYVFLMTMGAFGFEHVLYRFAIPYAVYSDMNGFAHVGWQVYSLIAYWACFCALLLIAGHLLYPRGVYASFAERMRAAVDRLNRKVAWAATVATMGFIVTGSWIFYNTNVLNTYRTTVDSQRTQADYELKYGQYESRPAPSFINIDMSIDLFPAERRLDSRGTAVLRNNKQVAIDEFVISVNPKLRVEELTIETGELKTADAAQGFYLFALKSPLQPGDSVTMKWSGSRANRGFVNADHDTEVVENGTFVDTLTVVPVPGFDDTRKLTDNSIRKKIGLGPADRLPALGDEKYLDSRALGIDSSSDFRVVMSTSEDQIVVAPGKLKRKWQENRRRYFEYLAERPIPPAFGFMSARYQVARDKWRNDSQEVELEVYYDSKHAFNVQAMLSTAKRSLDYFTREFSPYQFSQFRIAEYPRYRSAAKALAGMTAYSESAGFVADLSTMNNLDYATIHELSHMWWGAQAGGARMQGRQLLNESLAEYSTMMILEKNADAAILKRKISHSQRGYLKSRSQDNRPELPLLYTDDQDHISYGKGPLALYALRELLGEQAINQALRNYLAKFAFKPAPFPTSRDLVNELRAVAGAEYQDLITDLFEKIVLYDVQLADISAVPVTGGYEVSLTVTAKQFEANGKGEETEVPLQTWFDVALFPKSELALESRTPLYLKKHLLKTGTNTITIRVAERPAYASIDPFQKMADRRPDDNGQLVAER
jgi:ABC-2 type transport system permease protein